MAVDLKIVEHRSRNQQEGKEVVGEGGVLQNQQGITKSSWWDDHDRQLRLHGTWTQQWIPSLRGMEDRQEFMG